LQVKEYSAGWKVPERTERLLTVEEVADLLSVAPSFVYRHSCEMGAFKLGSHLRFRPGRLEEWLESTRLGGDPENEHLSPPPTPTMRRRKRS
jgi:excisionase family DNA binding protein